MNILVLGDFFYDYNYISDDIYELSKIIKEKNYKVILNLEGAITKSNNMIKKRGEHLRQSDKVIEILKMLNVVGVTLANNHIYDYGEEGLIDTINLLDDNNIQHSGAGLSNEAAYKPIIITQNNETYCFYSMTDSYEEAKCIDEKKYKSGCAKIIDNIKINKSFKNYLILHTGFEYNTLPMPRNITQSKEFINNGFDGVICMHPHIIQPNYLYNNKLISFSLGNFYFSSFRDDFNNTNINNHSNGYCNFGYGVLLNRREFSLISVSYDCITHNTLINFDKQIDIQELPKINFNYYIECFKNRNNHNPILTGINFIDNLLLFFLEIEYKVYLFIKKYIFRKNIVN